MRVIEQFWDPPPLDRPTVLTFGKFDALHIGHQTLFRRVLEEARASDRLAAVLFLYPHPLRLLNPEACPPALTSLSQRLDLLEALGMDVAVIARFDERLRQTRAESFLDHLVARFRVEVLVTGYSVHFGYRGEGTQRTLEESAARLGFSIVRVPAQRYRGEVVSSSRVRRALAAGDLDLVRALLGRRYAVRGTVVAGDGRGRELGFPTANVDTAGLALPPVGIYAAYTHVARKRYPSAVSLGFRPTFGGRDLRLETHLLDFSGDLYGQEVEIEFVQKIRDELNFPSANALAAQIAADVAAVRKILAAEEEDHETSLP